MAKLFCILSLLLGYTTLSAQTFHPDKYGHVSDPKFLQIAKERGYTIIGSFDTIPGTKQMAAKVRKNDTWVSVDLNGKETPLRGELGIYSMPAPKEWKQNPGAFGGGGNQRVSPAAASGKPETFSLEGKTGLKLGNKVIVSAIYDNIRVVTLNKNLFLIVEKDKLYGLCDFQGKKLTPIEYNMIHEINPDTRSCAFIACKDQKWGALSRAGTVTVPLEYDFAQPFTQPFSDNNILNGIRVTQGKLSGAYDTTGKLVVPVAYDRVDAYPSSTPRLAFNVQKNGKRGILSRTGAVTIPCEYNMIYWEKGQNYIKFHNEKYGALDTNGKQILPPVYHDITHVKDGNLLWVTTRQGYNNKTGLVDLQGRTILDTMYSNYSILMQNSGATGSIYMLSVQKEEGNVYTTGLYDTRKRQFILPCEYEIMVNYTKNPFMIKSVNGVRYFGLLSEDGSKVIAEAKYTYMLHLDRENMLVLQLDGKYGVTDMALNPLLPFKYEYLHPANKNVSGVPRGVFIFKEGEKSGVVNMKQQIIVPAKYDHIISTRSGFICVLGQQSTVLDFSGKLLLSAPCLLMEHYSGIFVGQDNAGTYEFDLYGNKQPRIVSRTIDNNPFDIAPVEAPPAPPAMEREKEIYSDVEEIPEFPGGLAAMEKYLKDNLRYPETAREAGLEGKCYLRFVINEDGSITNVKITRGVPDCPECDAEAKRLIKTMPLWLPARVNGKPVRSYFDLPVRF